MFDVSWFLFFFSEDLENCLFFRFWKFFPGSWASSLEISWLFYFSFGHMYSVCCVVCLCLFWSVFLFLCLKSSVCFAGFPLPGDSARARAQKKRMCGCRVFLQVNPIFFTTGPNHSKPNKHLLEKWKTRGFCRDLLKVMWVKATVGVIVRYL